MALFLNILQIFLFHIIAYVSESCYYIENARGGGHTLNDVPKNLQNSLLVWSFRCFASCVQPHASLRGVCLFVALRLGTTAFCLRFVRNFCRNHSVAVLHFKPSFGSGSLYFLHARTRVSLRTLLRCGHSNFWYEKSSIANH